MQRGQEGERKPMEGSREVRLGWLCLEKSGFLRGRLPQGLALLSGVQRGLPGL